jgi:DNA-binding transcriptional ArsR family regulator
MTADFFSLVAQMSALEGSTSSQCAKNKRGATTAAMTADGASSAVLRYLRGASGTKTEAEILRGTGRTHSAVSWALLFLRRLGMVESVPDYKRNLRYLRYRASEFRT